MHMRSPGPPTAWHIVYFSCDRASSTKALTSSGPKAMSLGPCPERELAPPVVANLITSAPTRTNSRTKARMSLGPLATPSGCIGSLLKVFRWPDAATRSPIPPVGETMATEVSSLGPLISP